VFREANWEADDLLQRYPDRPDRLYALTREFTDLDLFGGATRLGQAAYAATGVQTPTDAPRALLQVAYPRPFANVTNAAGDRYGLNPLFLESTLREATQFDAWSDDAATGARGLAAMSPIHADEASLALHAASGRSRAQAVPSPPSAADAIENQAWLLADRLRRYAGRPEAALGAIATTERLADGWLARAGSDDPEVMVESIDYEPVGAQLRDVFATELTYGIAYAGPGSAPAPGDPLHPMLPKPEPTAAWIKIARLAGDVPDPAPLSAEDIGNPDAPDAFQRGTSLARDGNFADAISTFQSAGSNPDPTQAAAAQLRLGQALLGAGRTTEAVSSLQAVDAQQPDQIAAFLLGKAFEALNRCDDAGAALDRFASANPGRLAAQARLAEATCLQSVGRPADAVPLLEQAAQAQDLPRLQQLDFRERLALARLRSGDSDGAIADYSGLLSEARTSSYRSELNYDLGVIAADPSTAVAHFRQAVQLDPKARAARAALDELVARQDSSATSLDAADTRFEQSRYLEALADYSTDQSTARAVYGRGVSLVRLAQDRRGIGVLESMATEFPDTSGAADGLFRAGRIRESLADLDGAANDYGTVIGIPNAGSRANDARFRLAFVQFEQGDVSAAANGWRDLAGRQSAASDRAQADFWLGKALHAAGAEQEAQTAWSAAASADPHRFYGLRAGDELNGQTDPRASADTSLQALQSHAGDDPLAPILAWAQSQPDGASALQRVQSDPAFVSADSLLAMGLRQPAIWQFEAVEARFSSDPAAMAVLGGLELRRGLYNTALSLGYDLASTAHLSPTAGPDALRRLIYPLPDPGVLAASAKEIHTDPLLFAALMHQESNMDETAESAAQARGLSQLTASTAYDAARALGVYAFTSADLYTPTTSIRLGAFTFAQRLNRYDQQIFPALAAYNAGPFSVDGWLLASGKADIDTFVEAVPFTETYPYVQAIYENYRQYLELYGSP
ncbi:MAG: transglycosylase SLT domain-containing protein, partial [Chloroflexi bacterium]|nr:transglycosylase SLT domain-containing protein [Chloroflexota bacterium]